MTNVSIRDLRNHGGDVVERASHGQEITITQGGKAVAELRPLARPALAADVLLSRWATLPAVDLQSFRDDIDAVIDPSL